MTAAEGSAPQARSGLLALPRLGARGWMIAGAALVAASAMLPVFLNSVMTSRGLDLQDLHAERDALRAEMRELEADVARLTSIERVGRRAREIGLLPGARPIYVTIEEAGPAPPNVPAEYLPEPPEPRSGSAPRAARHGTEAMPPPN